MNLNSVAIVIAYQVCERQRSLGPIKVNFVKFPLNTESSPVSELQRSISHRSLSLHHKTTNDSLPKPQVVQEEEISGEEIIMLSQCNYVKGLLSPFHVSQRLQVNKVVSIIVEMF